MPYRKYISLIFSPEGGGQSVAIRFRKWQLWALLSTAIVGWLLLVMGMFVAMFAAKFMLNQRALIAENNRLRVALMKADSLRNELDELRAMRKLLENALLVSEKRSEKLSMDEYSYLPRWLFKSSAFSNSRTGLQELNEYLDNLARAEAYIPSGLPARGVITARFGETGGVFEHPHNGVDIMMKPGTPIRSTADGIVAAVETDKELGNFIQIDHLNGYITIYAHLLDATVTKGQVINRGDVIGHSGETGRVKHPHLHYEVQYNGKPINPLTVEVVDKSANDRSE